MKKSFLILSVLIFFTLAPHVFAQGFVPIANIPGLTDSTSVNSTLQNGFAGFLNNLYKYLIGIAAILAVIEIIWGGLEISTQDSVSKHSDGKERIQQAILGLILVLSPVLVFSIINPSILNLSLNLPKLSTPSAAPTTLPANQPPVTDQNSGCSVQGTAGILQIATCPSLDAASTWAQSSCPNGNKSVDQTTNSSNGVVSTIEFCADAGKYVFIDTNSTIAINPSAIINELRPLVTSASRPTNGSDAMSFTGICSAAGYRTCVSDAPSLTSATDCNLTGANKNTSWKCYNETVNCRSDSAAAFSAYCSSSPSWTPFQ
jgi:hypothetical protein